MSNWDSSDRTIDGLNNQDTADLNITNKILIDGNAGSTQFLYADSVGVAEWKTFRPTDINTTASKITNAQLTNDSITINGVSIDLGASGSIPTQTLTATTPLAISTDNIALSYDATLTKISNELSVAKVPNSLTAGTNVSFSSGTTYDGSSAITISATDTNTTYTAGTNLNLSSTTFNLDTTIDSITITNGNLLNTNNRVLPPNVYNNAGQYVMPFSAGVFLPNDDNSYYNYCLDDDGAKTRGRGQIKTSSLELSAVIHIPRGWIATGTFMDIRDSSGNVISTYAPTYSVYSMTNFASGGTIADAVALDTNVAINTENTFYGGTTFTGVYNQSLLFDINMSSVSHYLGGGYILLNAPSGGGA